MVNWSNYGKNLSVKIICIMFFFCGKLQVNCLHWVCFSRSSPLEVQNQCYIGSERESLKSPDASSDCHKGPDLAKKKRRDNARNKSRLSASFRSELASRLDEEYSSNSLPRCAVKRKTVNASLMGHYKIISKPSESKSDDDEDEGIGSAESLVSTPELEEWKNELND